MKNKILENKIEESKAEEKLKISKAWALGTRFGIVSVAKDILRKTEEELTAENKISLIKEYCEKLLKESEKIDGDGGIDEEVK